MWDNKIIETVADKKETQLLPSKLLPLHYPLDNRYVAHPFHVCVKQTKNTFAFFISHNITDKREPL